MTNGLKSYTSKETKLRVTLCDECAEHYGLNNQSKYIVEDYSQVTNKVRPKANA